ncbi:MAG: hypothetical protein V3R99_13015, partial [Thermoguttaceae bacterium]
VMHEGRIVEQGDHRQLIAQQGQYAALWRAQTDDPGPVAAPRPATRIETNRITTTNGNGRTRQCATT